MAQTVFERSEVKFLLDRGQRARLERVIAAHMTDDPYGPATVRNVYYDTPTLLLARRSADHPAYREKLRARCYGAPDGSTPVFAELKKKYRGVTYKRRAQLTAPAAEALLSGRGEPRTQIERELDFAARRYEGMGPRVLLCYDRAAYVCPEDPGLRMTLDARPRARWERVALGAGDEGEPLLPDGVSILEVKCLGGMPMWLVRHLSDEGLRRARCSKYGLACRSLLTGAGAPR